MGKSKKVLPMVLALAMLPMNVFASGQVVRVDKEQIKLDGSLRSLQMVNIDDDNYVQIRELAYLLKDSFSKFDVNWNGKLNKIEITENKNLSSDIHFEGISVDDIVKKNTALKFKDYEKSIESYLISDRTYFKLRDLKDIFGYDISWNEKEEYIELDTHTPEGVNRLETNHISKDDGMTGETSRYGSLEKSFLIDNEDDTYSVLDEDIKDTSKLILDTYDLQTDNLLRSLELDKELEKLGGFYSGQEYNYIVFGANNLDELKDKEVIRVVKYDKKFNRLKDLKISGGESIIREPFRSGSCRIDESEKNLLVHTSRLRFKSDDGVNHQSQVTMYIDTDEMKLKEEIEDYQENHVSHSFDQYVRFDGLTPVVLDHGDAYPRCVVLHIRDKASNEYDRKILFRIPGKRGANATGVSLGGFEILENGYVVAMNSVDHERVKNYTDFNLEGLDLDQRDVILLYSDKKDGDVKSKLIGKYIDSDKLASSPKMIKLDENRLAVIYEEYDLKGESLGVMAKLIQLDGEIKVVKEFELPKYRLTNYQPKLIGDRIIWILNQNNATSQGRLKFELEI